MLFLSLILSQGQEYLLGSTSDGKLYVWLFEEIVIEFLNEKFEGENIFTNICNFKLKDGNIFNLKLGEKGFDYLFFHDDYFFYSYNWNDFLEEIKQRRLMSYPATSVTKFSEKFKSKLNINNEFGEQVQKITAVDYDLKGKRGFIGTDKGNVVVLDLEAFTILKVVAPVKNTISIEADLFSINTIKFYKENYVVFGNGKGLIELWDYEANKVINTFKLEKDPLSPVKCIAISPQDRWLIVGHNDYITRWHLTSAVLTSAMPVVAEVNALLPASFSVFSVHDNKYVYQWNEDGELLTKAETSVSSITTVIGDIEGKEKVMITAGNGPLVDVFLNSTRIISFLA